MHLNLISQTHISLSDEERYKVVAGISIGLCILLIVFPTLKISTDENVLFNWFLPLVIIIQLGILRATVGHPVNTSIFLIIFILVMSSAISFMEMTIVSWEAAKIILCVWGIIIVWVVIANWKVIWNEDIVFSKGMKIIIAVMWVIYLGCTIKCMVYNM
jgi:hypothetical protein